MDGYQGAQVSCSITSPGNGMFNVIIAISGVDSNGGKPTAVSFTSQITDAGVPAQMTFFSPDTGHLYTLQGSPLCSIEPGFEVGGGVFYGNISCPLIGATDNTSTGCQVSGTIAAENCTTD